ncbi:MAG: hypothetical protein CMN30_08835 [Sandaracinus sp.]|nr:hypothetical protein [Sandaracinus sp.]
MGDGAHAEAHTRQRRVGGKASAETVGVDEVMPHVRVGGSPLPRHGHTVYFSTEIWAGVFLAQPRPEPAGAPG